VLAGDGKAALAAWEKGGVRRHSHGRAGAGDGRICRYAGHPRPGETPRLRRRTSRLIALTAHAMKGTASAALAAGMDGLRRQADPGGRTLRDHRATAPCRRRSGGGAGRVGRRLLERSSTSRPALGTVGGRPARCWRRWLGGSFDQSPKSATELHELVSRGDSAALERGAHKIKSTVGSLGARRSYEAAVRLEELGRAGRRGGPTRGISGAGRGGLRTFARRWPSMGGERRSSAS